MELLDSVRATALADVRSVPVSRYAPQFNKDALTASLVEHNIAYGYAGGSLGGRPRSPSLFTAGVADYEKMAALDSFSVAIARLIEATERHRIAVMCSEGDPLDCHRCLLIGRVLANRSIQVGHVLPSGEVVNHGQTEERLLEIEELTETALLFRTHEERLAEAYRSRARRVAYAESADRLVGAPEARRA